MSTRSPRLLAVVLAVVLALALAACGDDDDGVIDAGTTTTTEATTTTGAAEPTTTATTAPPAPEGAVIEIEVVGGEPVGGSQTVEVPAGDDVTIRVTADTVDEIHVHGYDLTAAVGPDAPAEIAFAAEIPGQFEVELHESGALLVQLVVGQ